MAGVDAPIHGRTRGETSTVPRSALSPTVKIDPATLYIPGTCFTSETPPELGLTLVGFIHRRLPPRLTTPEVTISPPPPSDPESTRLDPDRGADSGAPVAEGDPPASPPREVKLLPPRFRPLLVPPRLLVLLVLPRLVPLPPPPPLSGVKRPLSGKERMRRLDLPIGPLLLLLAQAARTLDAAFRTRGSARWGWINVNYAPRTASFSA